MATAKIHIVGLCSFLNVKNDQGNMPDPSIIVHNVEHHTPFLLWYPSEVAVAFDGTAMVNATAQGRNYLRLGGEEISILNDTVGPMQKPDASFGAVAAFGRYARQTNPRWDRDVVPDKHDRPHHTKVVGFLKFGGGQLSADQPTKNYHFANTKDPNDCSTDDEQFARRGTYTLHDKTELALSISPLPSRGHLLSEHTTLCVTFRAVSDEGVRVWIGNSMDVDDDSSVNMPDAPEPGPAYHFKSFYQTVRPQPDNIYIPYPAYILGGAGYCGPDNQP